MTADRFTDTRKSIARRQKMHDYTIDCVLGVHVSEANLQKPEVQNLGRLLRLHGHDAMTQSLLASQQSVSTEASRFGHNTFRSLF